MERLSFSDLETVVGRQCGFDADSIQIGRQGRHPQPDTTVGRGFFSAREIREGLTLTISSFTADQEIAGTARFGAGLFIVVLVDGEPRQMQCGDRKLLLIPGTCHAFFIRQPANMHSITPRASQEKMVCVQATSEWLHSCGLELPSHDPVGTHTSPLGNGMAESLAKLFSRASDAPIDVLFCESTTLSLVATALDTQPKHDVPITEKMLAVRKLIDADPCAKHSLQSLSAAVGLSVTTLKTKFPKVYGTTVFGYIRGVRMEAARAALASRRWSVAEAAYAVGFNHPASFSTAYRRHFGHSPKYVSRSLTADFPPKNSDL